jgi:hypothetical protein
MMPLITQRKSRKPHPNLPPIKIASGQAFEGKGVDFAPPLETGLCG